MLTTGAKRRRRLVQSVPARITSLRQSRGWSQSDLAERLGWSVMRLSRLERGKTRALADDVAELADVFGETVSSFYGERA